MENKTETLVTEWTNQLRLTVSKCTQRAYLYHLRNLLKTAPDRLPEEWTKAHLLQHLSDRAEAGNGESARKQMVNAFRSFFRYALGDERSPARAVPCPIVHRRKQRTLDAKTMLKVLSVCDTSTPRGVRNLALLTLLLDTGLRASEVCRLKVAKLNLTTRRLLVVVKGGNEEEAVFSQTTAAHLARWLAIRGNHALPETETVFVSFGGTRPGTSMTREGLKTIFDKIGAQAGLAAFSPHDLRRTFATIAIKLGAPIRVVQAAGRWADLSLVERYTADVAAEDIAPYSPVESLLRFD